MATAEKVLPNLPALFRSLADPTRLQLLNLLSDGEVCVCHLSGCLGVVQPKISRHLAYLRRTGLVEVRREGTWIHYRWRHNSHPLVHNLLSKLRRWMQADARMKRDRAKLKRICAGNPPTRKECCP